MRALKGQPVDVSAELSELKHDEKQNRQLPRLPAKTTILKRPINHASIASPFAGPKVQKVVYVSRKTPIMSAVKRVKKFLREIEKRAMQSQGIEGALGKGSSRGLHGSEQALHQKLEDASERLRRDAEEVLVKASGRAMEQALRIGEWFRNKEKDMMTKVEVRTGSVSVIDDIVDRDEDVQLGESINEHEKKNAIDATAVLEGGDTTMELFEALKGDTSEAEHEPEISTEQDAEESTKRSEGNEKLAKRKRKRKRKEYDVDDMPEARLRWVKTVEIAITLRA